MGRVYTFTFIPDLITGMKRVGGRSLHFYLYSCFNNRYGGERVYTFTFIPDLITGMEGGGVYTFTFIPDLITGMEGGEFTLLPLFLI